MTLVRTAEQLRADIEANPLRWTRRHGTQPPTAAQIAAARALVLAGDTHRVLDRVGRATTADADRVREAAQTYDRERLLAGEASGV